MCTCTGLPEAFLFAFVIKAFLCDVDQKGKKVSGQVNMSGITRSKVINNASLMNMYQSLHVSFFRSILVSDS